jgi:PEP-CTERM putative exosortase interaction domain
MPVLPMRGRLRALTVLLVVLAGIARAPAAEDEVWADNPWGRVTIFGSGPLGTRLFAEASGLFTEEKSMFYLDTQTLPAEVESFTESSDGNLTVRATLRIDASNESGLLFAGNATLLPEGTGASGFAGIHLYLLVELLDPATIQIYDLRSVASGSEASGFSLTLFPSNESGAITGSALMEFAGASASGWDGTYWSDTSGFFRLEVSATALGGAPEMSGFDFRLDITDYAPVPEPAAGALVVVGGLFGWLAHRRARRPLQS